MHLAARFLGVIVLSFAAIGGAQADWNHDRPKPGHVAKIRITDDGPFQIWDGVDADSSNPGARVLAVIGPKKSLRVNYTAAMPAPQVSMGAKWVDIVAGDGTAMTFSGPKVDCYSDTILWCTTKPVQGIPPGRMLCYCTHQPESVCCTSDTGIFPKSMVPRDDGEL